MESKVYYRGDVSVIALGEDFEAALEIVCTVFKTNKVSLHFEDGDDFIDISNGKDWELFLSKRCDLVVKDKH